MTDKSQKMYKNALEEWIFKLLGRRINPHTVTSDFEIIEYAKESVKQQKTVHDYMDKSAVKKGRIDKNDGNFIHELLRTLLCWLDATIFD